MISPSQVDFFRPMLDILSQQPGTITLRTIYSAIQSSILEELQEVQRFYWHSLGACSCDACESEIESEKYLRSDFDPFLRFGEKYEIQYAGKTVLYSKAQYNFFREFIKSGNLAKIIAAKDALADEMLREQRKQSRRLMRHAQQDIVGICLALAPLELPPYVMLWIIDFIPQYAQVSHHDKIELITSVRASIWKIRQIE